LPRNGSGTYARAVSPYVNGTIAEAPTVNTEMNDIASALTQSLSKDGQTTPTANLPMGGNKHTSVGDAAARNQYASAGQVQDNGFHWGGTAGGTANALTLSPSLAITAYAAGQVFWFKAGAAANSGAATVAISGLSTAAIQNNGAALVGGEIQANSWNVLLCDGTAFQLLPLMSLGFLDTLKLVRGSADGTKGARIEVDTLVATGQTRVLTTQDRDITVADIADSPMQGRLTYQSTTQIRLVPWNGNRLIINNTCQVIPSAGVNLANTGLTAATLYYIYAYMNSGTMTLEASTTAHATDTTTGVEIKSGDATRTLVGKVYMDAGTPGTFALTATKIWVISWAQKRPISGKGSFTADRTASSSSYTEPSTEIRVQFICWANDAVQVTACGGHEHNATAVVYTSIGFDGTTAEDVYCAYQPASNGVDGPFCVSHATTSLSATANHYATLLGQVPGGSGTGTWFGSGTAGTRSTLTLVVQG
jgi:hypothetical protein